MNKLLPHKINQKQHDQKQSTNSNLKPKKGMTKVL